jgi:hypothetical protein
MTIFYLFQDNLQRFASDINYFICLSSTSQYLFMCSIGFWFMSKFGSFSVAIWPSQEKITITVITPIAQRIASIMFLPKNPPAVLLVFLGRVVDLEKSSLKTTRLTSSTHTK